MFKAFLAFLVLACASGSGLVYYAGKWWSDDFVNISSPVELTIKDGSSIHGVANELAKRQLITQNGRYFALGWRFTMPNATLKAGEYRFEGQLTPAKIARILSTGQVFSVSVTIPEGLNMYQIAEKLETVFKDTPKTRWLELMKDKKLLESLPGNPFHAEGFLFPDTYNFNQRAQPQDVIGTMIQTFKKNFSNDIAEAGQKLNLNPLQIVTLASIIEKETGKAEERPHISSVFHNRLRLGMRLQTDPTVIYGIWERYDGNIRKSDLKTLTPYNTYMISGLPPGPIASPGLAALKASVNPLTSEDLYFVSKGDGSHIFSRNLHDHQKSVYQYQIQPSRNRAAQNN
ncbi:MAG: endolytic transglycosylase MltG [Proteobacteria bacterium]|nr:endolytic transglycosylase MltG [Pseudomonadota bacterium]